MLSARVRPWPVRSLRLSGRPADRQRTLPASASACLPARRDRAERPVLPGWQADDQRPMPAAAAIVSGRQQAGWSSRRPGMSEAAALPGRFADDQRQVPDGPVPGRNAARQRALPEVRVPDRHDQDGSRLHAAARRADLPAWTGVVDRRLRSAACRLPGRTGSARRRYVRSASDQRLSGQQREAVGRAMLPAARREADDRERLLLPARPRLRRPQVPAHARWPEQRAAAATAAGARVVAGALADRTDKADVHAWLRQGQRRRVLPSGSTHDGPALLSAGQDGVGERTRLRDEAGRIEGDRPRARRSEGAGDPAAAAASRAAAALQAAGAGDSAGSGDAAGADQAAGRAAAGAYRSAECRAAGARTEDLSDAALPAVVRRRRRSELPPQHGIWKRTDAALRRWFGQPQARSGSPGRARLQCGNCRIRSTSFRWRAAERGRRPGRGPVARAPEAPREAL